MGDMGFAKQLNEEEASALTSDLAATQSNFFFKLNENKQSQN